jgi:hypothetical protein
VLGKLSSALLGFLLAKNTRQYHLIVLPLFIKYYFTYYINHTSENQASEWIRQKTLCVKSKYEI